MIIQNSLASFFVLGLLLLSGEQSMAKPSLKQYRARRDLKRSGEPVGKVKKKASKKSLYVIQKHDASHLHYDLRLEIDGVLVSWAIPKGPSLDPSVKRLAIQTDDHPMEYGDFEGIIPQGSYGAGTVMVWDIGSYENIKTKNGQLVPMGQCLKDGHIEVNIHGEKITGDFALIRTHGMGAKNSWLLIKMQDKYASTKKDPVKTRNKSALSGKTMNQIAKNENGAQWGK